MNRDELLEMISRNTISSRIEEGTDLIHEIYVNDFVDELLKAINVIQCCKSDSEQLPDAEKEKLIKDAYWLNLQNLSGREDFEKAFRLGIETGVDETLEKLQG